MMDGVLKYYKKDLPIKKEGIELALIKINKKQAKWENLKFLMNGSYSSRVEPGEYVTLYMNGQVMMSDTQFEKRTCWEIVEKGHGDILIAGLGIGVIVHNLLKKKEVKSITVIENNLDLIGIVEPKFKHKKLTIIYDDIFKYKDKMQKDEKYDCIWFDIWPTMDTDNLVDIKKLHNMFKFKLRRNRNHFMESWSKHWCQREQRESYRSFW